MRLVKIGIASTSPTVGAVHSNTDHLLELARRLAHEGATVAAFPEQAIGGCPPADLVQWRGFVAAQRVELERFASETASYPTVFVLGLVAPAGGEPFNVAAVVHRGVVLGLVPEEALPNHSGLHERHTLARGAAGLALDADGLPLGDRIFRFDFGTLAVEVCADAWSPDGPMRRRCHSGAEVVVNISASPYRVGMHETRREMLATRSADNQATLVYANAVGGQDGLVFDGGGFVFQNGRRMLEAPRLREGTATCVVDLDRTVRLRQENTTWRSDREAFRREHAAVPTVVATGDTGDRAALRYPAPLAGTFFLPADELEPRSQRDVLLDELFEVLALGVKDYIGKSGAFRGIGVALSGGRDSLLTLLVANRAVELLHPELSGAAMRDEVARTLHAFYMPSRHSTPATRAAAETACEELGLRLDVVSIDDALDREVVALREMSSEAEAPSPITVQNVQARLRAMRMWNWANEHGALFLQTGDMSEKAVGYTTVGGDLEGGLSPIANLPKTVVVALLQRLQATQGLHGITLTLATTPGPELAPGQSAEAELMAFEVLDACLHLYAGEKLTPDEVAAALPALFPALPPERLRDDALRFATLLTRSIYKWTQAPLALHVGAIDLDRERALQLPVVQRGEWRGGAVPGAPVRATTPIARLAELHAV